MPILTPFQIQEEYGFGNIGSLSEGLQRLVVPGFSIAATAVIFYFIIGAIKFLTSGGDKNAVESGRNMIIHAIIGFILLMLTFVILKFIPEFFGFTGFQLVQ